MPRASALSIALTGSEGRAMKKSRSGIVRPAVTPSSQVTPRELVCAEGTRTPYLPCASTNRYGFSRLTGVASSVVYGGVGEGGAAGGPRAPAKTWFQTPFDHPAISLLRVSHCCCEPLMVNGRRESAMKPPLANCGPAVQ